MVFNNIKIMATKSNIKNCSHSFKKMKIDEKEKENCIFEKAMKAIEKYDYKLSDELLKECIKQKDLDISRKAFILYYQFLSDVSTILDSITSEEVEFIKKTAKDNNVYAQKSLGIIYYSGFGVKRNYKKAAKWLSLAADKVLSSAQNNLGFLYLYGVGVEKNYREAFKLFSLAASDHKCDTSDIARINIGFMYTYGYGVEKNDEKAFKLCTNSFKKNSSPEKKYFTDVIEAL